MKVSRGFSVKVQYFLDQWVPPRIRDSKWFMGLPMRLVLGKPASDYMTFKDTVFGMTSKEFSDLYERTGTGDDDDLQGETDLNEECTEQILKDIKNRRVLEVGCGRGYLAEKLAKKNKVTACDIVIPERLKKGESPVKYLEANIESLPFKDSSFEYVVTTHTLEHVQNLPQSVAELRRVASKALVIVVPKQRPYKYTFSLHTQFFPYRWSLENAFGTGKGITVKELGDWYYIHKFDK